MKRVGHGLCDSLPIVAGYLPIAFAFGVAGVQSGLSPMLTILISAVVFAGGAQFVLLSLLVAGGTVLTIVPTVLLMNARHLLYGRPILGLLGKGKQVIPRPLLAFGLTDEVFAVAVTKMEDVDPRNRELWYLGLQLGAYLSWVIGTVLGCTIGVEFLTRFPELSTGLSFVLPAFFFSLLLNMKWRIARFPALVGAVVTAMALIYMSASIAIPMGLLAGALAGASARGET